jgi:muconolactone delta-isomerase
MTTDNWTPVQRKAQPPRKKKAQAMTEYNRREQARIEKLQAEVAELREALSVAGLWRDLGVENKELRAEVERLKAVLTRLSTLDGHAHMYRRIARAAVERKP